MRFDELHLLKYGNFEGCDLHFPKQPVDFHIVFGANEAGKSTTLAAVADLLFGFPHGKAQDYRFDASLLRVGAVLQQDAQQVHVRRKRGRASLMDGQDNPLDEAVLAGMMHGQTRETFHAAWSLDHRLLREGGQAIVTAKNDIGQALFAAGSGLTGVTRILESLEEEADQIWGSRSKASRSYTRVNNDLKDAEKRLRTHEVRPAAWKTAYDQLQDLEKQQRELDAQQQAWLAEQRAVERGRRVLEPAEQLRTLRASLAGQTTPLFTPVMESLFETTFAMHAQAVLQQGVSERLVAEEQKHVQAVILDQACLEREDEIEALIQERSVRQVTVDGLPAKRASLAEKTHELREALRMLRQPEEPVATLLSNLPARATVTELKRLLGERTELDSALNLLRDAQAEAEDERDASARALADHEVLDTNAELQDVVETARRMGDPDGQVKQATGVHADRAKKAGDAFARLLPWTGNAEALRRLTIPSEEVLQVARDQEFANATALKEEMQEASRLREELSERSLERELLLQGGTGVSAATVADSRAMRDACWAELRGHLEGKRVIANPRTEADRYESLSMQADQRADERFLSAEASGRLAQVDAAVAIAELHLANANTRVELAIAAQQQAEALWSEQLAERVLPMMSVVRLREWLSLRGEALEAAALAETSEVELRAHESTLAAARRTLASAIGQPAATKSFRELLDDSEARLKVALDSATTFAQLKAALHKAEDKVLGESRKVDRNLAASRAWQETWKQAIAKANLHEAIGAAELDTVEFVRATATFVQQIQDEIGTASTTQNSFLTRIQTLWAALHMPAQPEEFDERIDLLKRRLQTARDDRQRLETLTASLRAREEEWRTAEAQRMSAEKSLQPLLDLADINELPALAERVEESRRVRKVLDDIDDLKQRVLSLGDGASLAVLLDEAEGKSPDRLALRADELTSELAKLSKQIRDVADLVGVSRTNFQALDHGASASEAAADAEMARAELEVQAEAYLLKRTETLLLRWAVERKRKQTQNPLLLRAGRLFSMLTENRYSSLSVYDDGSDSSVLLGHRADQSRPVPVGNMSEGTIDQLFLALRIASIEQSVQGGSVLPVLADDLFINFDDGRAEAGFRVLGELARSTQVLFFTHHQHLLEIARKSLHPHETRVCNL